MKSGLEDWSSDVRDRKIAQLASIVEMMFDGDGPALLGVCEVENEAVVKMLADTINIPRRNYELTVVDVDHQVVIRRTATRDLFWVRLKVVADDAEADTEADTEFVAIANHWPSRTAGQYASEPFRILAGETHAYKISRFLDEEQGGEKYLPIISMGDYNDDLIFSIFSGYQAR